jgi:hypothetical protein
MLLEVLLAGGLQTPKLMRVFFLIGSLITGAFAAAILRGIWFRRKMQRVGIQASGFIVSQRKVQRSGRGSFETYLVPKVRYQILDGTTVEGESIGGNEVEFYDGQEAYLLYDADKPTNFLFNQEINQNQAFISLALFLIATLFSIIGMWTALELLLT